MKNKINVFCKNPKQWNTVILSILLEEGGSLTTKEIIQRHLDSLKREFGIRRVGVEVVENGFRPRHLDKRLSELLKKGAILCETHDEKGNKYKEKKWRKR